MSSTTHKMSDLNYKRVTGEIELTGEWNYFYILEI